MQLKPEVKKFVIPRWSAWLRATLAGTGLTANDLAHELKNARARRGEDVDDSNIPRSLVQCWLDAEKAVTADSAYAVGDALAMLGHPHASGSLAVVAAGHFGDFARAMRFLGAVKQGALLAAEIIVNLPLVAEAEVAKAQGWSERFESRRLFDEDTRWSATFCEEIDGSRQRVARLQRRLNSELIRRAWEGRRSSPPCESAQLDDYLAMLSLAIQIADARLVPMPVLWEAVAGLMDRWADVIVKRYHTQTILEDPDHSDYTNPILREIIRLNPSVERSTGNEKTKTAATTTTAITPRRDRVRPRRP